MEIEFKENGANKIFDIDEDSYLSINEDLNELALRVKDDDDYKTFIIEYYDDDKLIVSMNELKKLSNKLEIFEYFYKNENGSWSDSKSYLAEFIMKLRMDK